MYISRLAFVLAALSAASCIDKDVDNTEFYEKYARGFDNRTTVAVKISLPRLPASIMRSISGIPTMGSRL